MAGPDGRHEIRVDDDHAAAQMEFTRAVEFEARRIRIREAARAKITAEDAAGTDYGPLYLDRDELNNLPEPDPLIVGILPRHSYVIVRGRDHSFKSFAALDWTLCLATGKRWQDRDTEHVRVLWIAGEGAYGIARRIAAWEYAWRVKVDPKWLTVRRVALDLHTPGPAFGDLLHRVDQGGYGLVVADTLRRVSGRADGNSTDMGPVIDNLDRIKQATDDGSVIAISHTDKGDHDSRGFSGIEDDADVVWHAKRDEMRLTLELTKMKDGPDGTTIRLQAERTLDSLILSGGAGAAAEGTESQMKLLDTMQSSFPYGAFSGQLLEASGLPKSTYYVALAALRTAGRITNTGSNKRPFYELGSNALLDQESNEVQDDHTPSDLQGSNGSNEVQAAGPVQGPTGPTPLKGLDPGPTVGGGTL